MNFVPLPRDFYTPTADIVAPALLGHYLLRRTPEGICGGVIVETEAYITNDPACHAYVRETPRNRSMWGEAGSAYVYRIYGAYYCFNAVCCPSGIAEAVLVRAVEAQWGMEEMREHRPTERDRDLTNGPGKLCDAMQIDLTLDGFDICDTASPLFIASNSQREALLQSQGPMVTTTRIGITRAADWPLRFYLDGSAWVSRRIARKRAPA